MALIKCSECSAEISDEASCCPKCGAPATVHKWRCSKCGNMVSEKTCPHCNGKSSTVSSTSADIDGTNTSTPTFVEKNNHYIIITKILCGVIMTIIFFSIGSIVHRIMSPNIRISMRLPFKLTDICTKVNPVVKK